MDRLYEIVLVLFLGASCCALNVQNPVIDAWLKGQQSRQGIRTNEPGPIVNITNGPIEGTTYIALGGDTYYAYLGLPYAKAPEGPLRFEPPQPFTDTWGPEPRPAYHHPNACPQVLTNTTIASEDCLFVSVYTKRAPNDTSSEKLPVMYFIHGGGFILGQTSYYTGSKLLQQDVVLVTVQYRMGPFGFLSTGDDVVSGNMGMKDMVMGLQWIQDNIEAFGGDKDKVTLFGESAGAASTIAILISPFANDKGLFHSAAAMSGSALCDWAIDRDPKGSALRLAQACNCTNTTTSQAIKDCLMDVPMVNLSAAHLDMLANSLGGSLKGQIAGAALVIEPEDVPDAFLSKEPLELLETGYLPQIPIMMGTNQHEGSFIIALAWILKLSNETLINDEIYVHDKLLGDLLGTWNVDESRDGAAISQALAAGWFPNDDIRTNFTTFQYNLIDLASVFFFKAPVLRTADILSRRLPSVHLYTFEFASNAASLWNVVDILRQLVPNLPDPLPDLMPLIPPFDGGVMHGDDLIYMFSLPVIGVPNQNDLNMMRTYPNYFTNFAITGKPDGDSWLPFTIHNPNYMEIKSQSQLKQHFPSSWRQGLTFPEPTKS